MAVGVVHVLEAVEVDEGDGERETVAFGACQIGAEQFGQEPAVGQPGEWVVQGEFGRDLLEPAELGDVTTDTLQSVADEGGAGLADDDRAVGVTEVEVEFGEYLRSVQGVGDRGSAVVIEDVEKPGEIVEEVRRCVTEDVFHRRAHVVEVWRWLAKEAPDDVGRAVGEMAEPLLALSQLALGVATLRDIAAHGNDLCAVRAAHVPIDPLHPSPWSVADLAGGAVDQNRVVGTEEGELRMESVKLGRGEKLLQRLADCLCRLDFVLRRPGGIAVRDHVVRDAEAVDLFG